MVIEIADNLMQGKRGLITGVANDHSIAWNIAKRLRQSGAELAFTYQNEALLSRVEKLAAMAGSDIVMPCDVENDDQIENIFHVLAEKWGKFDFFVHAIAFSDRNELIGKYCNTNRQNFLNTLNISCYSFTHMCRLAYPMMNEGGSALTLTYLGSSRPVPNYNVMGVAKAALEASVMYLAYDLGEYKIRVNAISAGPMRTLAGAGIGNARKLYNFQAQHNALNRPINTEDIGGSGLYLLSDLSGGVTGEIHFVDCGFNKFSVTLPEHI